MVNKMYALFSQEIKTVHEIIFRNSTLSIHIKSFLQPFVYIIIIYNNIFRTATLHGIIALLQNQYQSNFIWKFLRYIWFLSDWIFETASCITVQKMKFSIMDFFSKCDQIRSFLLIWSHLLKKCVMKNFIFCAMYCVVTLLAASLFVLNFFNDSNSLTLTSTFFYWNILLYSNSFSKWYPSLCTVIELRYSNIYGNRDVVNTLQNKMNIASWFA